MKGSKVWPESILAHLPGSDHVPGGMTRAHLPKNVVRTNGTVSAKQLEVPGQKPMRRTVCVLPEAAF